MGLRWNGTKLAWRLVGLVETFIMKDVTLCENFLVFI